MTGLAVVLSLTLAGVIVAILTVAIFIMERKMSHDDVFMSSNGNLNSYIAALTFESEKFEPSVYLPFNIQCCMLCSFTDI